MNCAVSEKVPFITAADIRDFYLVDTPLVSEYTAHSFKGTSHSRCIPFLTAVQALPRVGALR